MNPSNAFCSSYFPKKGGEGQGKQQGPAEKLPALKLSGTEYAEEI